MLENTITNQYGGKLWAVNPKGRRIMDTSTFKSIETLPDAPEVGIICVPVRLVESSLQELIQKGTKAVVILTAGFSEMGEEGRIAENRLVELADRAGMALIGPNTMGILTTAYAGIFAGPVFKGEMALGTTDFISHNWILS
jgi:acyl-CoA synthetase (NDP forming)